MIKEKAYAKINLFLNVVNKRFDGYHDLEMVMAPIQLHDVVSCRKQQGNDITVTSSKKITTDPKENIVYKVAAFLQKEYNIKTGVEINVEKNIPQAAGLGGGSADAAATLRALNKLWKLKLSKQQLAEIGLMFGSDVPFCIYNKLCIAKGRGEDLVFINKRLRIPILLVNPNIEVSTKDVFSKVHEESIKHNISDMNAGIYNNNRTLIARELHNSLEQVTFALEPKVQEIKQQMLTWGLDGALMSGSGATVFGMDKKKSKLKQVYETFSDEYFKTLTKIR